MLLVLELEGGATVTTTEDHPFWNATDRQWQAAQDLDPGDRLLIADGTTIAVKGLRWKTAHTAAAYNLTVADLHTYYVIAGSASVLVHNDGGEDGSVLNRGVKPGEELSFAARLGTDFKVDPKTGFVIPGRGVSLTTDPDGLAKYGRIGVPVDTASIPAGLEIVQVGRSGHYELAVEPGVDMTPDDFQAKLGEVKGAEC